MALSQNHLFLVLTITAMVFTAAISTAQDIDLLGESADTLSDEDYSTNLNNQFILRFFALHKANVVNIRKDDAEVEYRPNGTISIGVGFNYKFLGLGISFGLPQTQSSKEKKGTTQRLDVQLSLFSKALAGDAFLQVYRGYYINNPRDLFTWESVSYPQLPDMQVVTLGVNGYYLFNNDRFSYRAAFIGNQVQTKSAGSVAAGIFGTFDQVRTTNGFVPPELQDSTTAEFDLKSFEALTAGLSAGYMYTFVLGKGFFISLAGIPGIGYRRYRLVDLSDEIRVDNKLAFHFLGRMAFGYNRSRYFINFNALFNVRNYNYLSYRLSLSTEQLRLTFGLRFETKASKKRGQYFPEMNN
jgi:hypothetical protein